jgi:cell division protein FtsI (penicillin-binding protein 3)
MTRRNDTASYRGRRVFLLTVMMVAVGLLVWRAVDLQVLHNDFLLEQGDARSLRVVSIPAHRGMITDRNGEPLAISTPVDSIWADPQMVSGTPARLPRLAKLLDVNVRRIKQRLHQNASREFVYLKRAVPPALADKVMALDIPGVAKQREYRRYYPAGEVTGHVLGFTNVDDVGQEGAELAFEPLLRGTPGSMRVIKDRLGRIVETVERISEPVPGHDLKLSIDRRIQYLAYRELKAAVQENRAASGSAVVLDVKTGRRTTPTIGTVCAAAITAIVRLPMCSSRAPR